MKPPKVLKESHHFSQKWCWHKDVYGDMPFLKKTFLGLEICTLIGFVHFLTLSKVTVVLIFTYQQLCSLLCSLFDCWLWVLILVLMSWRNPTIFHKSGVDIKMRAATCHFLKFSFWSRTVHINMFCPFFNPIESHSCTDLYISTMSYESWCLEGIPPFFTKVVLT